MADRTKTELKGRVEHEHRVFPALVHGSMTPEIEAAARAQLAAASTVIEQTTAPEAA